MENPVCCIGCGVETPAIGGPTHKYLIISPECWQLYAKVLARGSLDTQFLVNSYCAQHPDGTDPRQIQSAIVHLVGLYCVLEKNMPHELTTKVMDLVIQKHKKDFARLKRPTKIGKLTIHDVHNATNDEEYEAVVRKWAQSVWDSWGEHHDYIANLIESVMEG